MKRCVALLMVLLLTCALAGAEEAPVTRGEFVQALWVADGEIPAEFHAVFSDVGQNEPWSGGVAWGYEYDLVRGDGDGCFYPLRPVTREEAATVLRRYYDAQGRDTFLPDGVAECNDYADISPWADDALYWACDVGLLPWSEGGRLDPGGGVTAAELETVLYEATH